MTGIYFVSAREGNGEDPLENNEMVIVADSHHDAIRIYAEGAKIERFPVFLDTPERAIVTAKRVSPDTAIAGVVSWESIHDDAISEIMDLEASALSDEPRA